jgi:hypothetical protein
MAIARLLRRNFVVPSYIRPSRDMLSIGTKDQYSTARLLRWESSIVPSYSTPVSGKRRTCLTASITVCWDFRKGLKPSAFWMGLKSKQVWGVRFTQLWLLHGLIGVTWTDKHQTAAIFSRAETASNTVVIYTYCLQDPEEGRWRFNAVTRSLHFDACDFSCESAGGSFSRVWCCARLAVDNSMHSYIANQKFSR